MAVSSTDWLDGWRCIQISIPKGLNLITTRLQILLGALKCDVVLGRTGLLRRMMLETDRLSATRPGIERREGAHANRLLHKVRATEPNFTLKLFDESAMGIYHLTRIIRKAFV